MNSKIIESTLVAIAILAAITIIIVSINLSNKNDIIYDPTFVGEVVGKETKKRAASAAGIMRYTEYRLHIIGEYIENDKIIQIDRSFIVSEELFNSLDIGDPISNTSQRHP